MIAKVSRPVDQIGFVVNKLNATLSKTPVDGTNKSIQPVQPSSPVTSCSLCKVDYEGDVERMLHESTIAHLMNSGAEVQASTSELESSTQEGNGNQLASATSLFTGPEPGAGTANPSTSSSKHSLDRYLTQKHSFELASKTAKNIRLNKSNEYLKLAIAANKLSVKWPVLQAPIDKIDKRCYKFLFDGFCRFGKRCLYTHLETVHKVKQTINPPIVPTSSYAARMRMYPPGLRTRSPHSRKRSPHARTRSPLARSHSSVARAHSPVARAHSPVARAHSSVARAHSPVARAHSPVARAHSPDTRAHSPVARMCSPVVTTQPPVTRTRSPVARTFSPVDRVRSPCIPAIRARSPNEHHTRKTRKRVRRHSSSVSVGWNEMTARERREATRFGRCEICDVNYRTQGARDGHRKSE
eukprot:352062_1